METPKNDIESIKKCLGLSAQHITNLVRQKIIVKEGRGAYDLMTSIHNYVENLRQQTKSATTPELKTERALLTKAKREQAELGLAELRGDLIRSDKVKNDAFGCARTTRDKILGVADTVMPLINAEPDPHKRKQLLDAHLRDALTDLSTTLAQDVQ